jgi:polysaccharide pyruvyl transferase WcaK-like protein
MGMNIGLIGYYNQGNYGDDRILSCIKQIFCNDAIIVATGGYDISRLDELNRCDFVLLGGGGLVLPNMNQYAPMVRGITTRFGCIGLGVECRDESNNDLVTAIEDKAEFIYVRDGSSATLLNNPKKAIIGGDITFAHPFQITDASARNVCGVNLMCSSMLGELSILRLAESIKSSFDEIIGLPFFYREGDLTTIQSLFLASDIDCLAESFARCRFIVGMRFHSAVLAVQMGIPFVSLPYRPKSRRFCCEVGLENHIVELSDLHMLQDRIRFLMSDYNATRDRIIAARTTYINSTEKAVSVVKKLMK